MNTVLGPSSDVLGDSLAHCLGEVYLCLGLSGCQVTDSGSEQCLFLMLSIAFSFVHFLRTTVPLMFVRCSDVRSGIFCLASKIKSNYHTLPPVGSIVPGLSKALCARLLQLRRDCCPPLVPGGFQFSQFFL